MKDNFTPEEYKEDDIQIRVILEKYLSRWPWFMIGALLCLSMAYFYLRYTTPLYQASATILVKDDKKGGMLSELSAFSDMGLGNAMKSNVDNEIEIIKSRTLVESTVKKLKLYVSIFEKGRINNLELYKNAPIIVKFDNVKPSFFTDAINLEFVSLSADSFTLVDMAVGAKRPTLRSNKKKYRYGEIISTTNGDLIIGKGIRREAADKLEEKPIFIVVNPLENVVASYQGRLEVTPISKSSSVVSVFLKDALTDRAENFLNTLIQIYNDDAAADKNFISENTSKFIASRLVLITEELGGVEQDAESFKRSNSLTDIESEAQLFIQGSSEYNKKSVENEIQLNVVNSVRDFLQKSTPADLLPANIMAGEGEAATLINTYNQLVLNRNRLLQSASVDNPSVVILYKQIISLKSNVAQSLDQMRSSLLIQKRNLKSQESILNSKIGKIPTQERQFRVIARQQKVKEELYLYLLQKREETAISLAATAPNARVIDDAKAGRGPVAPKKNVIYLASLLLGLLIPFGIIYIFDLLDTKVKNRFDITDKFNIPFLGDIPKSSTPNEVIDTISRSSTAEALRIVRANLDFMLNQVPAGSAKCIFLTSTIPGEGKTFLSVNLAGVFALSGKKVLLVGMDIRSPKLNEYFGLDKTQGLTDYLSLDDVKVEDFIHKAGEFSSLDVLLSGTIPPNPTEMLMNAKIGELFVKLRAEYDFIIVDTAPVSMVSDTLILAKLADTFVYVVRAYHLDKRMLNVADMFYSENKLPNMAFLLNDTDVDKGYGYGGYGYGGYGGYGYGVVKEKKAWYKRIFRL